MKPKGRKVQPNGKGTFEASDCTLLYLEHSVKPEDFLKFVELDQFRDDWKDLDLDVESDLFVLQVAIMADPSGPPVISGTGGLRKLRFSPPESHSGKSGAIRVCYVFYEEYCLVLLVTAYAKSEQGNLSASEKAGIKKYIDTISKCLKEGRYG